ncbi:MAG: saccharopine dehydrogenase family protein [Phycisphaerales bacterium JB043]
MARVAVLGGGMVGSVMAQDIAHLDGASVCVYDVSEVSLQRVRERCGDRVETRQADLSDQSTIRESIEDADIVLGALASHLGFNALGTIIDAGKPYADISFMPEDAIDLDQKAKDAGVCCVVDCGVAPGMSNMMAGYASATMDRCDSIEIYVGGLPVERHWPFEYKAGFAPADVIEEYTRPSRIVENSDTVIREALSEPELMTFPHVGTLEAFNTDGLRSIATTLDVPNMIERTLRYPGHIEIMRVLRHIGLMGTEPIDVKGVKVVPRDVLATLMFPQWTYEPGEEDITVMRVIAEGVVDGVLSRMTWDLYDRYDQDTQATSMSRTTAFPCTIAARMILDGTYTSPGVNPPERLGATQGLLDRSLVELQERGVHYEATIEAIG